MQEKADKIKILERRITESDEYVAIVESNWKKAKQQLRAAIQKHEDERSHLTREIEVMKETNDLEREEKKTLLREIENLRRQLLEGAEGKDQLVNYLKEVKEQLLQEREQLSQSQRNDYASTEFDSPNETKVGGPSLENELWEVASSRCRDVEEQGTCVTLVTCDLVLSLTSEWQAYDLSTCINLSKATELSKQGNLVDIVAVVADDNFESIEENLGSWLLLADDESRSNAPSVRVRIWRSHIEMLPRSSKGDWVMLRNFAVCLDAEKKIPYIESREGSAWYIRKLSGELVCYSKSPTHVGTSHFTTAAWRSP